MPAEKQEEAINKADALLNDAKDQFDKGQEGLKRIELESLIELVVTLSRYNPNAEDYLDGWTVVNKGSFPAVCSAIRKRTELLNNLPF